MTKSLKTTTRLRLLGLVSALPLLGLTAQAQSSITNGLVAYWNFDSQDFKDSVGKFDGTGNGTASIPFVAGKAGFGKAIQLDGTDQVVEITGRDATYDPDQLAFEGGSVSIAGWFTVGSFDKSWQALVAKGEGSNWRVARNSANPSMSYAGGLTDAVGATDVTDGNWHHFVAISDAAGVNFGTAIYIDGQLDGSIDGQALLTANGSNMKIGDNPGATGRYWNGAIDDIAIWNRVLTPSEISALYAGGAGKPVSSFFAPPGDADNDGIPDDYEVAHGLNPNDPTDAAKDCNNNGLTNLQEYQMGLDPCDTSVPTVVSATTTFTFDTVNVTFSKPLDPSTATNIANYSFSPALAVTSATLKNTTVTLKTAKQTPGATAYTVTVKGVKDLERFEVPTTGNQASFYSYLLTKTGVLKFSYWGNITGTTVDLLESDPRYPATPDLVGAVSSFNSRDFFPDDSHENYGATIEGLLTPTESGNYDFFLRSDDSSELWISTDATEANLAPVAAETGCCNAFLEPGASQTTAAPIALVAGKSYFVRCIYKEGGGGDYGQVAWRKVGDITAAASLTPIPGKYLSSVVDLPVPAEGSFLTQSPAVNAKNVSPTPLLNIVHRDGAQAWTQANVSLKLDGAPVASTFTKDGNVATITFQVSGLLPSESVHTISLGYPDPTGKATTQDWSFTVYTYAGPTKDSVAGNSGLIVGKAQFTADAGGHSGKAGDYAIDFGKAGSAWIDVKDVAFINTAAAKDTLSTAFWIKKYDIAAGSAFWAQLAAAPKTGTDLRGFQAHVPWSDDTVYFDTAGCCDTALQRISDTIADFPDYSLVGNDTWWTNSWHHFVFTKKLDQKNVYIDGKLFLNGSSTDPLPTNFSELGLGTDGVPGADYMHGMIDDFAVFSTEISAADAAKLASGTSPKDLSGETLIAYWDFNDASAPPSNIKISSITASGGNVTITWTGGGTLQSATTIQGPWTDMAGKSSPATIPASGKAGFLRIKQ